METTLEIRDMEAISSNSAAEATSKVAATSSEVEAIPMARPDTEADKVAQEAEDILTTTHPPTWDRVALAIRVVWEVKVDMAVKASADLVGKVRADMETKVKVGTGTKGMEVKVDMGVISPGTEAKAKDRAKVRRVLVEAASWEKQSTFTKRFRAEGTSTMSAQRKCDITSSGAFQ